MTAAERLIYGLPINTCFVQHSTELGFVVFVACLVGFLMGLFAGERS